MLVLLAVFAIAIAVGVIEEKIVVGLVVTVGQLNLGPFVAIVAQRGGDSCHWIARFVGDDIDYPAGRTVTVEHGSRSAHDLYPLDAIEGNRRPDDTTHVDGIDTQAIDQNQCIAGRRCAETAHVDGGIPAHCSAELANVNTPPDTEHIGQVLGGRIADILTGNDANIDGGARVCLAEAGGGDDNGVELILGG